MAAKSPEEICRLFQRYAAEGNLEGLLNIYDAEAVFLDQSGELKQGRQGLREVLALSPRRRQISSSASYRSFRLVTSP